MSAPFRIGPFRGPDKFRGSTLLDYPLTSDFVNTVGTRSPANIPFNFTPFGGANMQFTLRKPLNGYPTLDVSPGGYADVQYGSGTQGAINEEMLLLQYAPRYTVEVYVNLDAIIADCALFGTFTNIGVNPFTPYGWEFDIIGGKPFWKVAGAAPVNEQNSPAPASQLPINQWVHLCVERDYNKLRVYAAGAKVSESLTWQDSNTGGNNSLPADDGFNPTGWSLCTTPGAGTSAGARHPLSFDGCMAGLRITTTTCRYGCPNGSIVPDAFPYSTLEGEFAAVDPMVSMLLHLNDGNLLDASSYPNVFQKEGSSIIFTGAGPTGFGNCATKNAADASRLFLATPGAHFDLKQNAVNLEFWMMRTGDQSGFQNKILGHSVDGTDANTGITGVMFNNYMRFRLSLSDGSVVEVYNNAADVPLNTWTHICYEKWQGFQWLFYGGVQQAYTRSNFVGRSIKFPPGADWALFSLGAEGANRWRGGRLDEIRLLNGALRRFGKNFTPPAVPF